MAKPIIRIHNVETDEVLDREMTNEEFAAYEIQMAEELARQNDLNEKKAKKEALLERLGITEAEANLLLS